VTPFFTWSPCTFANESADDRLRFAQVELAVRGHPTRDDSYNISHDYAVVAGFDDIIEMIVTSRGDNGVFFEGTAGRMFVHGGKITGKLIEDNRDDSLQ
jgi:hypothetical protein